MNRPDTQQQIRRMLVELLKEKPIEAIKVTELASRIGMNRVTFYRHYESVFDVLQELEDEFIEKMENLAKETMNISLDDRFFVKPEPTNLACTRYTLEHRDLVLVLLGPYGDESFRWRCTRIARKYLVGKAIAQGYIQENSDEIGDFLVTGFVGMLNNWLKNEQRISAEEFSVLTFRMIFGYYRMR